MAYLDWSRAKAAKGDRIEPQVAAATECILGKTIRGQGNLLDRNSDKSDELDASLSGEDREQEYIIVIP